jgi:pilus assembly protein CpaF
MEGDQFCMQDIFHFVQTGVDSEGNALGEFEATGVRPQLIKKIEAHGITFPPDLFHRRQLQAVVPGETS